MTFENIVQALTEFGFPVAIAIYLLVYQSKQMESFRKTLVKVIIGLNLLLQKQGVLEEYEKSISSLDKE